MSLSDDVVNSLVSLLKVEISDPLERRIGSLQAEMISGFEFLYAQNEKREQENNNSDIAQLKQQYA